MRRTVRRLRLEPFEDRSLPSATAPAPHPPAETAHTSGPAPESADEDSSEYAGTRSETSAARISRVMVPDYVVAAYPAAPPMPAGLTPVPSPVSVGPAPSVAAVIAPVNAAVGSTLVPVPPAPLAAAVASEPIPAAEPADAPAGAPPDTLPGPPAPAADLPAVPDDDFPPVGLILPSFDDLSLQLNLADWADAATRLFSGLDAVVALPDGESPWARLGYWALVIGTVGVTVELTRQGLRAKQPEPGDRPPFPVTR